jgi:hypothetical protein
MSGGRVCPAIYSALMSKNVDTPSLGLAIIARDEEATLPHLLASIDAAFDQVALRSGWPQFERVHEAEPWFNPLVSTILGRKPQEWFSTLLAERDCRPQPSKSRKAHRAEERARRKAERRALRSPIPPPRPPASGSSGHLFLRSDCQASRGLRP